jgi:hypothetical protein
MREHAPTAPPDNHGLLVLPCNPLLPPAPLQLKYLYTALTNAHLLAGWGAHAVTAVAAITCFALEDGAIAMKWPPLFHSAWHCLSAVTVGQTYTLLHHLERAQPAQLLVTPAAAI